MLTYEGQKARYMDGLRTGVQISHIQREQNLLYTFTSITESVWIRSPWYQQHSGDINTSHILEPALNVRMKDFEYGV